MRPVYVLLNLPRDTGAKSKNFAEVYMKVNKGLVMILVTFIITAVLWLTAVPRETVGALSHFGQLLGGLALNGLFLVFLSSPRAQSPAGYLVCGWTRCMCITNIWRCCRLG